MPEPRVLYLCAGPQSSGSTLVSWCFLQRADMDGILDARNDVLPELDGVRSPMAWCKVTISCFRLKEMTAHYEDEGWQVRPVMVVRDVRAVFNSLMTKHYGRNGVTAEEPPLRMRLRRFREDWQRCRDLGLPVLCYEAMMHRPEEVLRRSCEDMGLKWDEGMVSWPKAPGEIFAPGHGNPTFRRSRGRCLRETVNPSLAAVKTDQIPPEDLAWLEQEFAEYNRALGYPEHVPGTADVSVLGPRAVPKWENTRRSRKTRPLVRLAHSMGQGFTRAARLFSGSKNADGRMANKAAPAPAKPAAADAAGAVDPRLAH